ncbi:MAG: hypothetical protein ACI4SG_05505 [Oligosphaeraceae bacterium]
MKNRFLTPFLKALSRCTRLPAPLLLQGQEDDQSPLPLFWMTAARTAMGVAYMVVALLCQWLLKPAMTGNLLGALAVLLLHLFLSRSPDIRLAPLLRQAFQREDKENPSADLLAQLVIPCLLFLLLTCHAAHWLPAIFALGATIAAELSSPRKEEDFREKSSWLLGAGAIVLFTLFPFLGDGAAFRCAFIRGVLLLLVLALLSPRLQKLHTKPECYSVNAFLGTGFMLLLAVLANAL